MDEEDKRHEVSSIEQVPGLYMSEYVCSLKEKRANVFAPVAGSEHLQSTRTIFWV